MKAVIYKRIVTNAPAVDPIVVCLRQPQAMLAKDIGRRAIHSFGKPALYKNARISIYSLRMAAPRKRTTFNDSINVIGML